MTTTKRVEAALVRRGLRQHFSAIERNRATPGEVVLWPHGKPVYSCRQAVEFARKVAGGGR